MLLYSFRRQGWVNRTQDLGDRVDQQAPVTHEKNQFGDGLFIDRWWFYTKDTSKDVVMLLEEFALLVNEM